MTTIEHKADATDVEASFAACSEDVRSRARNFWYGLRLLPPDRFRALCAIYSWMRRADDIADEDAPGVTVEVRRRVLDEFRARTSELFSGSLTRELPPEEAHLWVAMDHVARHHVLEPRDFGLMIDGQLADLQPRALETTDELLLYCDQVASTVGRTCVRVWGASDDDALEMAGHRGVAFQVTNILRDVREDHERGRCYVPRELLDEHGLDVEALLAWSEPARCRRLVGSLVAIARRGYERSRKLDERIDPTCRPTSWAMTAIYRSLLEKIAHRPHLIAGNGRVRLSSLRKAAIALRARRFAWYRAGEHGEVIK